MAKDNATRALACALSLILLLACGNSQERWSVSRQDSALLLTRGAIGGVGAVTIICDKGRVAGFVFNSGVPSKAMHPDVTITVRNGLEAKAVPISLVFPTEWITTGYKGKRALALSMVNANAFDIAWPNGVGPATPQRFERATIAAKHLQACDLQ